MSGFGNRLKRIAKGKVRSLLNSASNDAIENVNPEPSDLGTPTPVSTQAAERIRCLEVLELGPNANPEEIKQAYRRLSREYHPDRFHNDPAKEKSANLLFVEINRAFETLKKAA